MSHLVETMAQPYTSYLMAKKTVDDRALNRHVLDALRAQLPAHDALRVLEVGGGVGTMIARLVEWQVLAEAHYTLLDRDGESLAEAPRWLAGWAAATRRRYELQPDGVRISGGTPAVDIRVQLVRDDLERYVQHAAVQADLLIANAVLDLVDVPKTLPALLATLARTGLYWFSINFDGETIFLPEHPADDALIAVYHRSMNEPDGVRRRAGDSRTGRHLFQHLPAAGASILAAGSSDWIVYAAHGRYPALEGEFIAGILDTIDAELSGRPEVDHTVLHGWLATRRAQLAHGELVYIAHQLDFAGRREA